MAQETRTCWFCRKLFPVKKLQFFCCRDHAVAWAEREAAVLSRLSNKKGRKRTDIKVARPVQTVQCRAELDATDENTPFAGDDELVH